MTGVVAALHATVVQVVLVVLEQVFVHGCDEVAYLGTWEGRGGGEVGWVRGWGRRGGRGVRGGDRNGRGEVGGEER